MRIIHCLESLDPAAGGPARSVPQLALAQARLGHEVGVWTKETEDRRPLRCKTPVVARWAMPGRQDTRQETGDRSQGAGRGANIEHPPPAIGYGATSRTLNIEHRSGEGEAREKESAEGMEAGAFADLGGSDFRIQNLSGLAFAKALEKFGKPDIVHDHGIWLPFHKEIARECARRGVTRVVSPRGMLEPWALNHKKWKKKLAWWLYQRRDLRSASALHATAESEARQLRKLGFNQRIITAANGVDIPDKTEDRFAPRNPSSPDGLCRAGKTPVVARWAMPGRQDRGQESRDRSHGAALRPNTKHQEFRTALFLSRIHPKKGLPMLIGAWAKVQPAGWRMRVVGPDEGRHLAELETMVVEKGLSDVWSFDGALEGEAKWQAFHAADLFVLPTHSENFGIAVAEALACGLPAITTTGAPWAGLLEHRCGWWVAPETSALTEALGAAFRLTDDERRAMGARGREWMKAEFGWEGIARKVIEGYEEIMKDAG
ncbi:MAG: glycosyltransferase [Verrucomicrobiales bacterium]